jgi:hypothetical protein
MKVSWKLAGCVIGLAPLIGRGEVPAPMSADELAAAGLQPATTPTAPPTTAPVAPPAAGGFYGAGFAPERFRPGMFGGGPGGGGGRFPALSRLGPIEPPTQSEWEDATPFLKEHSPKRLEAINSLPDERRSKWRLMGALSRQYQNIQKMQQDDPDLAKIVTGRMELEDALYGMVAQFREAKRGGDTEKQAAVRRDMKAKVAELVDTNIKERKLRIARLEKTLKQESDRLADDEKGRESLVEKRVQNLLDGQPMDQGGRGDANPAPTGSVETVGSAQP